VGRGVGTSIKELTQLLLRLTESDLEIQYEPAGLTFVTNRIGCPKKAEHDLGYKWTIELEEGMKSLIEWRLEDREALLAKQMKIGGVSNL
jgi:UDP-glucose 4-epimerase